jgi:alkylhydroperoxidase family enzyme
MRALAVPFLLAVALPASATSVRADEPQPPPGQFPAAGNDDAWARLPRENPPLPPWARVLVGPLPKTTARMLELDSLHRANNPLGPELAGLLQWTTADALGSKFGKATAEADLRRFPGTPSGANPALPAPTRLAAAFARKLTLAGHTITDDEFAELLRRFGPESVTAIVHTVAYANFQNRIVLGLGAVGDPVPPIAVAFDPERLAKVPAPARPPWDDLKAVAAGGLSVRVGWNQTTPEELALAVEKQKQRPLRIPLPDPARFENLPPREKEQAGRINWMAVSSGYQPGLTRAWFAALSAYYEEAKVDRVFTNLVFWVVTRTNDCFY